MTKRTGKRRSGNGRSVTGRSAARRRASPELQRALRRAQRLIDRGRPEEAADLLAPLAESHPNNVDVHFTLGFAFIAEGDVWGGLWALERVRTLSSASKHLLPLASAYLDAGFPIHALRTFRRVLYQGVAQVFVDDVRQIVAQVEDDLTETAREVGLPAEQVERGLYHVERGLRAIVEEDLGTAISANRQAIKRLGDWPPPHNNLAEALFDDGQPEEAMKEVRAVLASHPGDVRALFNGIRFLAWSGREEAREFWARLESVEPEGPEERYTKGEVAAILGEHASVYESMKSLRETGVVEDLPSFMLNRAERLLAVAEANLGRRKQAMRRLRSLADDDYLAAETLDALEEGRSGTGWTDQFRYFAPQELLPGGTMEEFIDLLSCEEEMAAERFQSRIRRFARSYPQLVLVSEKMMWEEQTPGAAITVLRILDTPEAHAALRRFARSQVGSDQERMEALAALLEAGEIEEGETVRAFLDGEWREVEIRAEALPWDVMRESEYPPHVRETLNRAMILLETGEEQRSEKLFERVLELDLNVKEAYNNLGAIYARRDELERARALFRKAVEIDPLYVFPLGNLVNFLLDEGRVEEAEETLAPLSDATGLLPLETAFYNFTRARILVRQCEYESAVWLLEEALEVKPDYEPAQDMLEWMEDWRSWEYWDEQWERDLAWREQLQECLDSLEPTVAEALPLYTKDMLTAMAREVHPEPGWSSLWKVELVEAVIEALLDRRKLRFRVKRFEAELKEALRTVLNQGGAVRWQAFEERYGSDLEESRYWHWYTPESTMGLLRLHGLLVEAVVKGELYVVIPVDLREPLREILG